MSEANNHNSANGVVPPPVHRPPKPKIIESIKDFFSKRSDPVPNIDADYYSNYRNTSIGKK